MFTSKSSTLTLTRWYTASYIPVMQDENSRYHIVHIPALIEILTPHHQHGSLSMCNIILKLRVVLYKFLFLIENIGQGFAVKNLKLTQQCKPIKLLLTTITALL